MVERATVNEKLDVLDFVISAIQEHEDKLDNITERLEDICNYLELLKSRDNSFKLGQSM